MNPRPLLLPRQWEWWGLLPTLVGLYALSLVDGILGALFAGVPGLLWVASGLAMLLLPGDPRVTAYMALASTVAALTALPVWMLTGFSEFVLFVAGLVASFMVAGRISLTKRLTPTEVPEPDDDLRMQAKVGFDEAILGYFLISARVPSGDMASRMCDQSLQLAEIMQQRGWLDRPETFHATPAAPQDVRAEPARSQGIDFEQVSFDSEHVVDLALPGATEWGAHYANRRAAAWMLRHPGPSRPWLICIHGYRMGMPWLDFRLFRPDALHRRLGLNVLMPVLPLHGQRRIGRRSGDHYLDGDLLDLLFAQSQALWDLRRWLAWLRENEDRPQIGLYGVSLGGYNTGLLTGYESGIDFGVANIPVMDFAATLWGVIPPPHRRYFEARGLTEARYREVLKPVSPLSRPTLLPRDRRFVVAATADRVVPVAQPLLLAQHWETECRWYQGSHMSIGYERAPGLALEEALRVANWDRDPQLLA
ncbi:alpha/beta hydrolase family protein [Panacagrimonas sp.]|uniref:alpha/beta hydrolase family protein n=1 Tax=Panacagrimonas sp. TaxID=2480088 RepID=UPI003B52FF63